MDNDIVSGFKDLTSGVDRLSKGYGMNLPPLRIPAVETAVAAKSTADELKALNEAFRQERKKRDEADKKNTRYNRIIIVIAFLTLAATITGILVK